MADNPKVGSLNHYNRVHGDLEGNGVTESAVDSLHRTSRPSPRCYDDQSNSGRLMWVSNRGNVWAARPALGRDGSRRRRSWCGSLLAYSLGASSRRAAGGQAPPSASGVFRSFDRVLLLEEKGETSASVNVGDLNGDGLPDIVLGKGRHWPLFSRVLLNDGKGGFTASNLGTTPTEPIRRPWRTSIATATWTSSSATMRPIANLST